MPVLAPYIEPLDMVTMLMGDYKSGDVVCREASSAMRLSVSRRDRPLSIMMSP